MRIAVDHHGARPALASTARVGVTIGNDDDSIWHDA